MTAVAAQIGLLLLLLVSAHGLDAGEAMNDDGEPLVVQLLRAIHSLLPGSESHDWETVVRNTEEYSRTYTRLDSSTGYDPDSLPYFKIFPEYMGTVGPNTTLEIPGTCWYSAQVTNRLLSDNSSWVTITLGGAEDLACHTTFILSTGSEIQAMEIFEAGDNSAKFEAPYTRADEWDLLE